MLYVSGQAGPRVSFLCRMLQIVIYRSKVIRMKCSLRWSCINHGELHCDSVDSSLLFFVSLLTGARISFLGDSFLNKGLTVFGLFCYHCCLFVIRQDHGFGSPSEPHQLPGSVLSCFYKSNFSCSLLWLEPAWRIERQSSLQQESSRKSEVGS